MNDAKNEAGRFESTLPSSVQGDLIVALGWQDLCGVTRVRGIPLSHLNSKTKAGLGFPTCGQAMTISGGIAANRWGPVDDVRQIPVLDSLVQIPRTIDYPGFNLVMAETVDPDGKPFECCTRHLFKSALEALHRETGLEFASAFEHEFTLTKKEFQPELCMTLGALRAAEPMAGFLLAALRQAGIGTEAFEPEFGNGQYELSCGHVWGVEAADKTIATREIIRDVARQFGYRASFSPKLAPDQAGNGAHIHFSLRDADKTPVLFDASNPDGLSDTGGQFAAGIIRHINAIMAFAASSPVSYMRLGPGKWSAGFNAFGPGNREAVVRICDLPMLGPESQANSFNLEFRAADNVCNPYLVLTMIVRAGLQGIIEGLPRPKSISVDPATIDDAERTKLGIEPLPTSLEQAMECLKQDKIARAWLPESLYETYVTVKDNEIEEARGLSDEELCSRSAKVY